MTFWVIVFQNLSFISGKSEIYLLDEPIDYHFFEEKLDWDPLPSCFWCEIFL